MVKNIFFIPARSGSKGVIDKNIQLVGAKSLIQWAVEFAENNQALEGIENAGIYLSTDSQAYIDLVANTSCEHLGLRAQSLSGDKVLTRDVIKDFLKSYEAKHQNMPDVLTLLQPTSPLRTTELLKECLHQTITNKCTATSIQRFAEPHPYKLLSKGDNNRIKPFMKDANLGQPRQSLPDVYCLTGAIYCYWTESFFSDDYVQPMIGVEQDKFVNIDTHDDLEYARYLQSKGQFENV